MLSTMIIIKLVAILLFEEKYASQLAHNAIALDPSMSKTLWAFVLSFFNVILSTIWSEDDQ